MPAPPMTKDELVAVLEALESIVEGGTYRDTATGWVGSARKPADPIKITRGANPPHRPMIALVGASSKEDRDTEIRTAFLDDIEPATGGPVGFGAT